MVNKFHGSSICNSSSNIPLPKFCQIISSSHELCRLRIPEGYARRYCKNMLNPVYLEVPNGEVWEVEVEHSKVQILLAKGWKNFVEYYSISLGHFLMFEYNARSNFNVTIFDLSAAEIEYTTTEIESDDSIDISNVDEHSAENLSHGPLVEERKRKKQKGEEEDDIPVNPQTNVNAIEKEKSPVKDYEEHEQQPNISTDQEDEEADSKSKVDGPKMSSRYSVVNLIADNPFYEMVVKKIHTTYMIIPMRFAERTRIIDMKNIRLVNEEGKEWRVEIGNIRHGIAIKGGWAEFRAYNKIASGETCRFTLIQGHADANILQVQKIPTPGSLQYY